ncbi:MAG: hypothetical protein MR304_10855 [Eubacterium sp.]|nr:hypothetical protein [Eubacterium sp.]
MMRKRKHKVSFIALLVVAAALVCTGCGYKKPETHSMLGLNLKSITTVCGTDCTMSDIDINSTSDYGTATYVYTDVADDKGISDARKYHDYLKDEKHCVKIDDFDENKGNFTAYFQVTPKNTKEGFSMKVSFKKDSYTVHISDNVSLEDASKED